MPRAAGETLLAIVADCFALLRRVDPTMPDLVSMYNMKRADALRLRDALRRFPVKK